MEKLKSLEGQKVEDLTTYHAAVCQQLEEILVLRTTDTHKKLKYILDRLDANGYPNFFKMQTLSRQQTKHTLTEVDPISNPGSSVSANQRFEFVSFTDPMEVQNMSTMTQAQVQIHAFQRATW
jgi:hypothetical protein